MDIPTLRLCYTGQMGIAENIRNSRVRAGKTAKAVAAELGLNDAWYADLESRDDELASTLSLFQAMHLASLLGVSLHELIGEPLPDKRISLLDFSSRLLAHIRTQGKSLEEFESEVGWELQEFLQSPFKSVAELPIAMLRDLSKPLGMSWLSLVPEENKTTD
jgi:transcriptional regulator with XRE-family HTH domain